MRGRRTLTGAAMAMALAALACLNDTPVDPGDTGIRLELHTQIVGQTTGDPGTSQTVQIAVFYHRVDGDSVQLTTDPPSLTVAAGSTTQQALAVDIGPCLTDTKRVGAQAGGCQLSVVLRLLNTAGDTLDVQTITPPDAVTPGQTVSTPAITLHAEPPALLLSASAVTFNVAAGGPTPPPDSVSVTTDRGTARALQATVSFTSEAPPWLSAAMSADTTPAQLILTPAAPDLAPGTYTATVIVQSSASGVVPHPDTVAVAYNVAQPSVASLTLTPAADTILVGDSTVISIAVKDPHGNVLTGRQISWATDSPSVASLGAGTETGITVTGVRQGGPVRIIGTVEGVADTSFITVLAPVANVAARVGGETIAFVHVGDTVTASATLTDSAGDTLTGRPITWTSTNAAVATVDATTGDSVSITTHVVGTAYIKATNEGKSDSVQVTVQADTMTLALPNCPTISPVSVTDINDNDVVVGVCGENPLSFTWSPATLQVMIEAPPDSGFLGLQAVGINNGGEIALTVFRSDETPRAGIRTPDGSIVVLPLLPGGSNGSAAKINEFGQVLGQSDTASGGPQHTFVWTPSAAGGINGTMVDVDVFGGPLADGDGVAPVDIDDAGNFVVSKGGVLYLVEPATRGGSTGTITPLTGLQTGAALNNSRQVAGDAPNVLVPGTTRAAVWEGSSATALALPPDGRTSSALDINDLGQIVGSVEIEVATDSFAVDPFIWTSATGIVQLSSGIAFHQAQAVNSQGIAVGDNGAQVILFCTSAATVSVCLP